PSAYSRVADRARTASAYPSRPRRVPERLPSAQGTSTPSADRGAPCPRASSTNRATEAGPQPSRCPQETILRKPAHVASTLHGQLRLSARETAHALGPSSVSISKPDRCS